jgi:SAM-dependent methyltransferase
MNLEKILYAPFGNNIVVGKHIKDQLKFLSKVVPEDFKGKEIYDLGCGDGKITILLQDILKPSKISGCDVSPGLVKRAEKKGIAGRVYDLEDDMPKGEFAIVWGVIHHLKNQMEALKKIKENFQFLFLREPLMADGKKSIFELGEPFEKEKIEKMCGEIFGECEDYEYKEAYFLFWQKNK